MKETNLAILITLVLLLPLPTFAKNESLLTCLGKEEESIHRKKIGGVAYRFNQNLIESMIMLGSVDLKKSYLRQVCKDSWPSLKVFELLIEKSHQVFHLTQQDSAKNQELMQKKLIDELDDKLPDLFSEFIQMIQKQSPSSNCLTDQVPELVKYFEHRKYLDVHQSPLEFMRKNDLALKIIKKLRNYDQLIKKCQKAQKKS